MIDHFYDLLTGMGYVHPLHPPFTHGPIGAVIAAFCLGFGALIRRRRNLLQSAYDAMVIAWLLFFPTVLAGYLDWQHYYSGALIFPIKMKIALAVLLLILLSVTLIMGRIYEKRSWPMMVLFTLSFFNVLGLGYFGGQLVYEGRIPSVTEKFQSGRKIFINRCSGCHANGGNILYPNLPLRSAPQLESYEMFLAFIRAPRLPDGTEGPMPAFDQRRISDQETRQLYEYIRHGLANPTRSGEK